MESPFLSVIVPAYNEELRIADSIDQLCSYLSNMSYSWELIVVNDGSDDKTAKIVDDMTKGNGHLRLINATHQGKGAAVKLGMLTAKGKWRFLSDADLSMPPSNICRFFSGPNGIPNFDVSIGSREIIGSKRFDEPLSRHILGRIYNWTVKLIVVRGIEDTQCGFKMYSAEAAETIFSLQRLNGWGYDVENLFLANKIGLSIGEIPIDWRYHSGGKMTLAGSINGYFEIFRVRLNHLLGRYRRH